MTQRKGRPRKPDEARRDDRLPAPRVTTAERLTIEDMAARAGIPPAEFIRRAALGQRVRARRAAASDQLIVELNRIGVNLNQITARMHLTGELASSLPATVTELRGLIERVAAYDA